MLSNIYSNTKRMRCTLCSPCLAAAPCWRCAVVERLGADAEGAQGPLQRDSHRHLHSLGNGLRNAGSWMQGGQVNREQR
jgi:hypothetical protein